MGRYKLLEVLLVYSIVVVVIIIIEVMMDALFSRRFFRRCNAVKKQVIEDGGCQKVGYMKDYFFLVDVILF